MVGKLTTNADSPSAKVVLFPEQVGLGNRVWVDKDADGLQDSTNYDNSGSVVGDEPAFNGATGITFTLRKYDGDGASIGTETANPDGNGYYFFDGLYPAKLKDGVDEEAAYTGGNLNPGQLKGVLSNNYQLVVSGIPEGYFVTEAFAGNKGTAPHFGLKEEAFDSDNSNRKTDSNFKANGDGTYSSERFYLSAKGDDLSKDLGLVRYRHLQLIKLEEVSKKPVEGAVFTIYGPYTDDEIEAIKAGTKTDWREDEDTVGTMTTDNNGFANFESTGLGHYLNFYQNYIVEETSVGAGYKKDSLKVRRGSNVESLTINGTAVSAFVLKAMSDSSPEANPDGVTVNEVDATNKYESKGEIIIGGTKSLTGRDLEDAPKFSFTLTGEHKGGKQIKLTATNDANGAFAFGKIEYTQEDINPTTMTGSYEYTVSEVKGNEASYTYSNVVYKVKVNLEDNGEGKIKATPSYSVKGQQPPATGITFENHYTATGSTVIEGTKNLTGRDLEDRQFEFVLSRKADDPATPEVEYEEIGRTRNDAAGKFSFGLNYTQADVEKDANGEYTGEYEYKITEVDAGAKGYTYSKAEYMVKVTLKDNGAGHIEATQTIIQPADASQIAFENTYKAEGRLNLTAKKVLTGRTLEKGKFEFVLKEVGGELELTATNDALGNVAFPTLVYTEADVDEATHKGEVTYQMRERVTAPESGYTYSEVVYTVKVSLTDNGDGSITAAKPVITYVDEEGVTQTVNEALFENAYNSKGGLILSGVKLLSGRKLEDQQFEFVLEAKNAAQGEFTLKARNDANGAFAFDEITYTQADVDPTTHTGSYEYTVYEVDEGKKGYTYSDVRYTVTVSLTDNGEGTIKAKATFKGTDGSEELKFSNEYHSDGEVIIGGTKSLTGRELKDAPEFSFKLTGQDKDGKPVERTATNDADGAFAFDKITYTEADVDPETHTGSYEYTVTEEKQNEAGYTYSEVVYKVKVDLEDDGEGNITATPSYAVEGQQAPATGIAFENHYTATGSTVIEGTKDLTGRDLEDQQFEFVLSRKADDPATPEVEYQEIGRTRNDAAGKFSFGLNYTQADVKKDANGEYTGEYEYKVTEVDAGADGYTYSKAEYTVKVTLKDNGDGSIGVQQEIEGGGAILFENSYASTGSTVIQGTKSLTGRDLEDGQFEFVLKEVGGELELTAQNDEEGKIVFPAIHYTQQDVDPATHEGEYTYQVYESNQDEAGYTYSDVVYTVKVSLTDNGDGTITPTQTVVEPSGETQIAFENSYEAEGNLSLNAQKVLTGRQLEADQFEFVLVAQNAAQGNFELNARNDAQGRVIFPAIEYTEADVDEATHQGEYIYQMYEKAMGEAGYTYSNRVYTIKVSLTDNGDGTITAIPEITYVDEAGATQTVNEALFENSYQTGGGLILSGVKLLNGRRLEDQQFGFVLEAENAAQGKFTLEARNDANGAFAFDEITYTEADVDPATHTGSYEYTVREVNEGETGYTYSDVVYTVRVSLTDNGAGEISASAEIEGTNGGDALVFTNEYNADGRLRIEGTKRLEPRALNADDVFTFVLRAQNAAQGEFELRAQNDITGAFAFDEIEFTQADLNPETHTGEYVYTLYEENDGLVYYGYDATRYQLTVSLTEDGEGNVQASITEIRTADGQAVEEILFTNSYQAVGGAYIEATKQLERGAEPIRDGEFSFELYEVVDGAIGQTPIARTTNSGVKIAFPRIEYEFSNERDDRGIHTYIMREVRGTDENMIYSEQEFQIVVEVTDDEKGNLIARVDYADQDMTFVNSALETRVSGVKTWNDYDNRFGTRPESITVNLYADGERIQSATVTAADNWAYAFENLPTNRVDPATGAIRQIVYTVDEEPVAGYTGEVVSAGEQTSGRERSVAVNLTNTVHELRISKRTAEGAGLAGARLRLFKVEDEMIPVDTWTSTAGVHTIYGLEAGTYRLVELDAPMGYDVALPIRIVIHEDGTVESDALRGDTVVMVDDLSSGRINITGLKYWVDRNNEAGERPENINVTLYADGEAVDQQPTWTKYDNIWEYAFTGLLEENLDGSRIVYTVREEAVPNYDTTYDGLNITNTIQAPSSTFTGIVGQKTWVDNDNAQGRRPEAITVYLRRDGVVVDSQQVTEAGNWTYSFQNLPETNGYGRRYTYTIDEAAVPGYFKRVNGYDLTNTLITTREVTPPERPPRTPEENVTLITMLDAEVPLFGGLLKTGDELPVYPFVFGGIGLMAAIAAFILSRKKRAVKEGR